jgi:glycosidase
MLSLLLLSALAHAQDPCHPSGSSCVDDLAPLVEQLGQQARGDWRPRIGGFGTDATDATGLVDFPWDGPGDSIGFELRVYDVEDPYAVDAQLWTNADHADDLSLFDAVEMRFDRWEEGAAIYRVDLPVQQVGNYRAVGRISRDGGESWDWMGGQGIADVRFRPRDERHDALNMVEINVGMVNFDPETGAYGTFADLMEPGSPSGNGRYTLEWMAAQGKTAIWMMPPFEVSKWEGRHPLDDAGSPYAAKDFFSVSPELARSARGLEGQAARDAANAEFRAFMERAHELGIKVVLDVALNHVGHDFRFADLFVGSDAAGNEVREVRYGDYSQVVTSPEQAARVERALQDDQPDTMERVAPWMYGSAAGDPHGAAGPHDKAAGGWFEWNDVAQLNHGRMRHGYHWWDSEPSAENLAVQEWLIRVMRFWAVDMGVDGFRLDHLTGLPLRLLEHGVSEAQADVDRHTPGRSLFVMGEDFHTNTATRHWLDAGQGGWYHEFLKVRTPADLQRVMEHPWFHDLANLDSHDEERFQHHFGHDLQAGARMSNLIELMGGPYAELAGDELGSHEKLRFKQYAGIDVLLDPSEEGLALAQQNARVGMARRVLPALADDNRVWLPPRRGGADDALVAVGRVADDGAENPVVVFGNLSNRDRRENAFELTGALAERIDPEAEYMAYDRLAEDPAAPLWDKPIPGRKLLQKGIYAAVDPYGIQVVELEKVEG